MTSDPITGTAVPAPLKTETTERGHTLPRSRLISEADAQTR